MRYPYGMGIRDKTIMKRDQEVDVNVIYFVNVY